jgi:Domain of unknown function (DUF4232)
MLPLAAACGGASVASTIRASPLACSARDLHGAFTVVPASAGAGQIGYLLTVRNVTRRSCWVSGLPAVRLLGAHHRRLPTQVLPQIPGQPAGRRIVLDPGDSASAAARFSPDIPGAGESQGAPCEPVAIRLRIAAPGGGTLLAPIEPPTRVCSRGALGFRPLTATTRHNGRRITAMSLTRTLAAAGVLATAHAAAAAAANAPAISQAKLFWNPAKTAACGIEGPSRKPTKVLCSARGIPRPTGRVGDPYAQIAATGRPRLVLISQDSYMTNKATTLTKGTLWRSLGVTCGIGSSTILCFNRDNHGFLIGDGGYRSF